MSSFRRVQHTNLDEVAPVSAVETSAGHFPKGLELGGAVLGNEVDTYIYIHIYTHIYTIIVIYIYIPIYINTYIYIYIHNSDYHHLGIKLPNFWSSPWSHCSGRRAASPGRNVAGTAGWAIPWITGWIRPGICVKDSSRSIDVVCFWVPQKKKKIWRVPYMVLPKNGWFIIGNPIFKWMMTGKNMGFALGCFIWFYPVNPINVLHLKNLDFSFPIDEIHHWIDLGCCFKTFLWPQLVFLWQWHELSTRQCGWFDGLGGRPNPLLKNVEFDIFRPQTACRNVFLVATFDHQRVYNIIYVYIHIWYYDIVILFRFI